jgi:hypothetical protein
LTIPEVGGKAEDLPLLQVALHYLFVNPKVYLTITHDGNILILSKNFFKKW